MRKPLSLLSPWPLLITLSLPAAAADAPAFGQPVPSALQAPCAKWAQRLPNLPVPLCEAARLAPNGAKSVKGALLYQRDVLPPLQPITPVSTHQRLRVLVVGGIHGDELSSASLVFHWIEQAQETAGGIQWRFVPLLNPDGAMQPVPSRVNARGVDLNRNFPTSGWASEAPKYWAERTKKDPRRYPGPAQLSEPESRWLHEEMERFKPNLIVSVHAPYGVLDFDGPSVPPQRLGRLYLDQIGIFPGSLGHYGGLSKGIPVVTIELPSAIRTPTTPEIRQMWIDLLRWIGERMGPGESRVPRARGADGS
jgi:murein peptide amidase A